MFSSQYRHRMLGRWKPRSEFSGRLFLLFFPVDGDYVYSSMTIISHTLHFTVFFKAGSRKERWWSPLLEGLWIARIPAITPDAPSQGQMKWSEMNEMSVKKWWNEICGRGKLKKFREKPTQTPFRLPRNPHGVTETRTRDPSGGRWAPNRLRHEAASGYLSDL